MVEEHFDVSGRHDQQSVQSAAVGSVDVLLSAAVEDRERLLEVSRWWLTEARLRLCGALSEGLRGGLPTAEFAVGRIGVPGLGGGNWSVSYTPDRFEAVVASLSSGRGDAMAHLNADPEELSAGDCCSAHIALTVDPDLRPWVTFSLRLAYRLDDAGMIPIASQDDLVAFVRDFAELTEASFANIASDNSANQTALETYLPRPHGVGLMESPSVVRGYSWVTLVPATVVRSLGGVEGLQNTGAFAGVAELNYGAALLRATRRFEEYEDSAVERVFHALAPALPEGVPRRLSYSGLKQPQLIYKNAADYRDFGCPAG